MYNKEKFEREIVCNEKIYGDTNIAMSKGFSSFIENYKSLFRKHKKKIIIITDVYQELLDKSLFGNESEIQSASKGLEIINQNIDIFEIEDGKKISGKVFADPKLLARLIENEASYTQMLITRDGDLSVDAKRLNLLNSVNGKPIKVCYINKQGEINRFKRCEVPEPKQEIRYIEVERVVEKPIVKIVKEKPSELDTVVKPILIGTAAGISSSLIISNRKKICQFINNVICKTIELVA